MKTVKMIALRDFPMRDGDGVTKVRTGQAYEIPDNLRKFHTDTKRGKTVAEARKE